VKTSTGVAARPGDEVLKAIDFFKNCAETGGNPTAKDIFISIADEERFHYDLLQA
jgi:rubrerythrin